ncbi:protein transporter SEC13 [Trichophyton rubrum D6]|uniref:Protein transport protein SEC13 n=3 Tax=Trichophyton TaxID=5550 RepID=A0A080WGP6_TRIRC|nr:protein transporter SEC13 [Trichophyton rubrum CBS 118892]EZF22197.1 protein transporter SEC13 [Trichophyton rubrum MR850]EZF41276.1 protein transporter SEC13 [Trichophyton rubrum CBS 100081]EZF51902.1 protein transporter SEC13 [Trichophyton rubrum CBS 288.86]EZF62487.1 protein transporter SEC13 [Trichophyton rubrum CBS 289.86]EZF73188.1 protein transporter SEC13 [Trichophyton soudanense CBS 452.61]EZF83865.1 protein transporter SEC13 [Trichophyton rubrum MR1448]EZF94563.1 protein transpo
MAQVITNSGHDDMIHDAGLDYFGRKLATCSSDKTVKIFEIEGESHKLLETLKGHEGAVWCVAWAHPKYGTILASSSYDGKVLIWREQSVGSGANSSTSWSRVFDFSLHTASVNMVCWAPHELGCLLACASSDGQVSVLEFRDNSWTHQIFHAHGLGVNSISWAPAAAAGSIISANAAAGQSRRFVTCGSDNLIFIWDYKYACTLAFVLTCLIGSANLLPPSSPETKTYSASQTLQGHTDWVRDVAWSPSILSRSYIASASQDKTVRIWTSDPSNSQEWTSEKLEFDTVVWRVSWSLSGNILAVSGGDNKVSLWKEDLKGKWEKVKDIEE